MGTTDFGSQTLSFDYNSPGKSEVFNKLLNKLVEAGVYDGGLLSYVDNTHVSLATLTAFINDSTTGVGVRVETNTSVSVAVSAGVPYIILRFAWVNVENNYVDVLAVSYANILPDDLIIGRCVYTGGILQSSFDYSHRMIPVQVQNTFSLKELQVTPKEPIANTVYVNSGDVITSKGKISFLGGDSPSLSATTLGRNDIIYLDKDGAIKVTEGVDSATPSTPLYGDKIVLAEIKRGASQTYIGGETILNIFNKEKYVKDDPWFDITEPDMYEDSIAEIYEGVGELFEYSSQVTAGSKGSIPSVASYYRESTNSKFWSNRGSIKFVSSDLNVLEYNDKVIANTQSYEFYIYPNWSYTTATDIGIFDTSMGNSDTDNFVKLRYNSTNDTLQLIVQDDASHTISSETVAYTSDIDLQQKLQIKISWSGGDGSTSNVFFSVNGVTSTNTTTGDGIANIDLTLNTGYILGCNYPTTGKELFADMWLTDMLINNSYSTDISHYTNGKFYIVEDRIMGKDTNFFIDKNGSVGTKNLFTEKLFVGGSPIKSITNIETILDPVSGMKYFPKYNDKTDKGLLPFDFDNAVLITDYQDLYDEIGNMFEDSHTSNGDDATDAIHFYPTPPPSFYTRVGIPNSLSIDSTADVNTGNDTITLSEADYNKYKRMKFFTDSYNGVPVYLTGTLPTGLSEGTVYYLRFIDDVNFYVQIHLTEKNAIDNASKVDITATVVGTFNLTQEGIVLNDALKEHQHFTLADSGGGSSIHGVPPANGSTYSTSWTSHVRGVRNARTSNETRPKTAIMFAYIKAKYVL